MNNREIYTGFIFDVNGTSLQGEIDCSYDDLVSVFGKPNGETDGYKVDAEWEVMTPAEIATIYNYKSGKNYLGEEGEAIKDIRDFHIGGRTKEVADYIVKAIIKS